MRMLPIAIVYVGLTWRMDLRDIMSVWLLMLLAWACGRLWSESER
jgi:hypothetical protein